MSRVMRASPAISRGASIRQTASIASRGSEPATASDLIISSADEQREPGAGHRGRGALFRQLVAKTLVLVDRVARREVLELEDLAQLDFTFDERHAARPLDGLGL